MGGDSGCFLALQLLLLLLLLLVVLLALLPALLLLLLKTVAGEGSRVVLCSSSG